MTEEKDLTRDDINQMGADLKANIALFSSQIAAQADRVKTERVNGIVELAAKAGKEKTYPAEKLATMSDETLEIVENSLSDLIKEIESNDQGDESGGSFNDRGSQEPTQVSSYELTDGLVDIISHGLGLPILDEKEKEEVRIEHWAEGLRY